jgi:hypothetical protein
MFGADVQVELASDLELAIQETLFTAHVAQRLKQSLTRLKATEVFMKEIGHELAIGGFSSEYTI